MNVYHAIKESLHALTHLSSVGLRQQLLNALWESLRATHHIPLAFADEATFLYNGDAERVQWNGDFNRWGGQSNPPSQGKRIGKSDIWMLERNFPSDARLDYKIVLNGKHWMLDPANPFVCVSGYGASSELRMPMFFYPPALSRRADVKPGTMSETFTIQSRHLGYAINFSVYTPSGSEHRSNLPVIYATDGHEYASDEMGGVAVALDNLIHDKHIKPVLAVFIDPRNPANPDDNRRMEQYACNPKFLKFVTEELVPLIDATYRTAPTPDARLILGTSMGGLCAAYFAAKASNVFHLVAIQSPAFWNKPEIFQLIEHAPLVPMRFYMSVGLIYDLHANARRMRDLLELRGYELFYREFNQSHSWGNWRGQMEELLRYFWGTLPSHTHHATSHVPNDFVFLPPTKVIRYTVGRRAKVSLKLYDRFGKTAATLVDKYQTTGRYTVEIPKDQLEGGVYFYQLCIDKLNRTKTIMVR